MSQGNYLARHVWQNFGHRGDLLMPIFEGWILTRDIEGMKKYEGYGAYF